METGVQSVSGRANVIITKARSLFDNCADANLLSASLPAYTHTQAKVSHFLCMYMSDKAHGKMVKLAKAWQANTDHTIGLAERARRACPGGASAVQSVNPGSSGVGASASGGPRKGSTGSTFSSASAYVLPSLSLVSLQS